MRCRDVLSSGHSTDFEQFVKEVTTIRQSITFAGRSMEAVADMAVGRIVAHSF
ncbi:MAG: hypothetical protein KDA93_14900 [Planctomycetaceae bacterium]|nr:hypothetical protein [Planctomycetaceae bacterium]